MHDGALYYYSIVCDITRIDSKADNRWSCNTHNKYVSNEWCFVGHPICVWLSELQSRPPNIHVMWHKARTHTLTLHVCISFHSRISAHLTCVEASNPSIIERQSVRLTFFERGKHRWDFWLVTSFTNAPDILGLVRIWFLSSDFDFERCKFAHFFKRQTPWILLSLVEYLIEEGLQYGTQTQRTQPSGHRNTDLSTSWSPTVIRNCILPARKECDPNSKFCNHKHIWVKVPHMMPFICAMRKHSLNLSPF